MAKRAIKKKKKKARKKAKKKRAKSRSSASQERDGNARTTRPRSSSPPPLDRRRRRGLPPHLVQYQFKKGHKKTPGSGRPKGSVSIAKRLINLLRLPVRHPGKSKISQDYTYADLLAEQAINAAANGEFRFFQEIFNRVDGKVPDHVVMEMTKRLVAQEAGQLAQDLLEVVGSVAQDQLDPTAAGAFLEACSKAFDAKFADDVAEGVEEKD